jgi:hypothetical protein
METPFIVLSRVAGVLDELGISYVVVGSFASSMRGLYRATGDIDIMADIKAEHVQPLVAALLEDFYVDDLAVRRAVARHGSFNAIHFDSVFKIDVFIPPADDFSVQQLARRQLETITPDANQKIYVATAEDTVLAKLKWYRAGGEVSDVQWRDVLGVIGTQGESLDVEYLRTWAAKLNLNDLLERVLSEAS